MTKTERVASLQSSKPALQTMESLIELQKALASLDLERIEKIITQVPETAAVFGDLMAKELIPVSTALMSLIPQVQDATSNLETVLNSAHSHLGKVAPVLINAEKALKQIQVPKEKTPLETLQGLVPLATLAVSIVTLLAVVLTRV